MENTFEGAIEVIKAEIADFNDKPDRLGSLEARGILVGLERALEALSAVREALL